MTDEELERLKRLVAEEEERRNELQEKKDQLKYIERNFGLQKPNGWCRNMEIKIIQEVDELQGVDGNGGIEHKHYEVKLDSEEQCELLFEAFKTMADFFRYKIDSLEREIKR